MDEDSWRLVVADRISRLDFGAVVRDVGPFLERPEEAALLTAENLCALLRRHDL